MFTLRACVNTFRSGLSALRTNYTAASSPEIISKPSLQFRGFSSTTINAIGSLSCKQRPVTSTLPAITFKNYTTTLDGLNVLSVNPSRSIMKIFWPRPREHKRIKTHGWKTRMSTPSGRRIIMRRILKGRHILSH